MRIAAVFAVVVLALALAACQTVTPEQRRAADEATCSGYGFRRGTDSFANCMMNQELARRADTRAFLYSQDDDFFWGPPVIVGGPGYRYRRW